LRIGVDSNELNASQTAVDHAVDGVDATAPDPYYLDQRVVVVLTGHRFSFVINLQALVEDESFLHFLLSTDGKAPMPFVEGGSGRVAEPG
jgi:hypothetical protein